MRRDLRTERIAGNDARSKGAATTWLARLGGLVAAATWCAAATAGERAQVTLTYDRGGATARTCPDEPTFRGLVSARLGYDPFAGAGATALAVSFRPEGRQTVGRLALGARATKTSGRGRCALEATTASSSRRAWRSRRPWRSIRTPSGRRTPRRAPPRRRPPTCHPHLALRRRPRAANLRSNRHARSRSAPNRRDAGRSGRRALARSGLGSTSPVSSHGASSSPRGGFAPAWPRRRHMVGGRRGRVPAPEHPRRRRG